MHTTRVYTCTTHASYLMYHPCLPHIPQGHYRYYYGSYTLLVCGGVHHDTYVSLYLPVVGEGVWCNALHVMHVVYPFSSLIHDTRTHYYYIIPLPLTSMRCMYLWTVHTPSAHCIHHIPTTSCMHTSCSTSYLRRGDTMCTISTPCIRYACTLPLRIRVSYVHHEYVWYR